MARWSGTEGFRPTSAQVWNTGNRGGVIESAAEATEQVELERRVGRLKLLASALAGKVIDVVGVDHGEPSWTDGTRIFVDRSSSHRDQIRAVAVQASLLAEGSLAPGIMAALIRRDPLARRYLAIEGSRALAAQEQLLPPFVGATIDRSVASRTDGPESSLVLAQSKDPIAPAP